ncbi:MAG: hypothetical protein LBS86_03540 [Treponema sp.]|jgi:hypothetical protein|nr:hypothetical protein [Treponema sp.]
MKKLCAVCLLGVALAVTGAFAQEKEKLHPDGWGLGAQFGFDLNPFSGGGAGGGGAFSLKAPALPIYWTFRLSFGGNRGAGGWSHFGFGVSGDYYFIDQAIVPDIGLGWYLGGGAFVGYWSEKYHRWNSYDTDWSYALLQIGGELPIGIYWMIPIPVKLELYLQAVPNIGVQFAVGGNKDYYDDGLFWFSIGGNIGVRIWLG